MRVTLSAVLDDARETAGEGFTFSAPRWGTRHDLVPLPRVSAAREDLDEHEWLTRAMYGVVDLISPRQTASKRPPYLRVGVSRSAHAWRRRFTGNPNGAAQKPERRVARRPLGGTVGSSRPCGQQSISWPQARRVNPPLPLKGALYARDSYGPVARATSGRRDDPVQSAAR
jgi:hypothetical protein